MKNTIFLIAEARKDGNTEAGQFHSSFQRFRPSVLPRLKNRNNNLNTKNQ
jgi:hypothetical protein